MPTAPNGRTGFPNGIQLGSPAVGSEIQAYPLRGITLPDPALAVANRYVVSTNMIVGAYTVANASPSDGLARNVTVTATAAGGADTMGTITVTGTDVNGAVITEVIIPSTAGVVAGLKAFKTVTGIVGAGWVINAGNDTIVVGFGTVVGLPVKLRAASDVVIAFFNNLVAAATVVAGGEGIGDPISSSTIDMSAGTYDGAKDIVALIRG